MLPPHIRIAPSILSADFGRLADQVALCVAGGADWIHVDVMDGAFVPNLTFGSKVIEAVRRATTLPVDVHMMVWHPERYLEQFAGAGATGLTIHAEATPHVQRYLAHIRTLGCDAGLALNPGTPLDVVSEVAADLDTLLIMTVNPGFGGQAFIPASADKVARARRLLTELQISPALEVDGGIARDTILACRRAGAEVFVAGNAIFGAADPKGEIAALRAASLEVA